MAQPTSNGILKFLFKAIVLPIIVIVLIVGIGVVVLGSMTPAQLGVADLEFAEGVSIRSMGFADMKIFDIIKEFKNLFSEPNLEDIVSNAPDPEVEEPIVELNLGESSASVGGEIDYLKIAENAVIYDEELLLEYNDTTIAFLINEIISAGSEQAGEEGEEEAVEAFKELNAKVEEIIINVEGTERTMRFVISLNIETMIQEATEQADNPALNFALRAVPSKVYMVSDLLVSADANGKLVFVSEDLRINDQDNQISEIILGLLSEMIDSENPEEGSAEEVINKGFGEIVGHVVGNLGKVGTADANESTHVITGNIQLGNEGILDGKITVITYTEDPSPSEE